jgi:polysaccharide pyruvyl transferase WcaK-like protein
VAGCDAVVLGGGGLWTDYTFQSVGGIKSLFNGSRSSIAGYARPGLSARAQGLPFHVFGIGAGPLIDPDARQLVRFVGEQATSLVVRDAVSRDLLTEIDGWTVPIAVAPDPVYALELEPDEPCDLSYADGLPVMVVNLRRWDAGGANWRDRFAHALDGFLERSPHALVGLPMQQADTQDEAALWELFQRLQAEVPRTIVPWTLEAGKIRGLLAQANIVVAMRLHACLLAHRAGLPVLGLAYDPKVTAHFGEIGRSRFAVPLTAAVDDYRNALGALVSSEGPLDASTRAAISTLERASRSAIEELLRRLPDVPSQRRGIRIGETKRHRARASSKNHRRALAPPAAARARFGRLISPRFGRFVFRLKGF